MKMVDMCFIYFDIFLEIYFILDAHNLSLDVVIWKFVLNISGMLLIYVGKLKSLLTRTLIQMNHADRKIV